MKIKLVQSGGFLPVTSEAETEVNWSKEEVGKLLDQIRLKQGHGASALRDGIDHSIEIDHQEIPVDLAKASGKYAEVLGRLRDSLKIIKT
jgi:hypothetical protein